MNKKELYLSQEWINDLMDKSTPDWLYEQRKYENEKDRISSMNDHYEAVADIYGYGTWLILKNGQRVYTVYTKERASTLVDALNKGM